MDELEKLLKGILPEKKEKRARVTNQDIHNHVDGKYIAEDIFLIEKHFSLKELNLDEVKLHNLIRAYSKIKTENKLLFIDTETTGLAGGSGTYVFLIGIGFFTEEDFVIEQYFLADISKEKELLKALQKKLKNDFYFVSYNGKSYDIPLLKTRSIFHQLEINWNISNIDLLHLARRFWRSRLSNFSLKDVEKIIPHIKRNDIHDISGSEIPDAYFDYLETRDARVMKNVIYHNKQDILSLAIMLDYMNKMLNELEAKKTSDRIDQSQIGRLYLQCGFKDKACEIFKNIIQLEPTDNIAIRELSYIYKQSNSSEKSAVLWEKAAKNDEFYACIELAKWEEHSNKNYTKALQWTEKAIGIVESDSFVNNKKIKELYHRIERVKRKQSEI